MARKEKVEEPEEDKFIVLFTALSMILLAFFIMLNGMATQDDSRSRQVLDSLMGTFGPGLAQSAADGTMDGERILTPPQLIRELELVEADLNGAFGAGWSVEKRPGQVVVTMPQTLLFSAGGIRLNPASFDALDRLARLINRTPYKLRIIGHSDGIKPKGKLSNWYYSAARASSVHRYLEDVARVEPGRIRSLGVAYTQPWPPAVRQPDDASHRRVELVILIPDRANMQVQP